MIQVAEVLKAIQEAKRTKSHVSIKSYEPSSDLSMNEYCLFFKPELTEDENKFEKIFKVVSEILEHYGQNPSAACVIEANYLVKNKIMNDHYGVIDMVSRNGKDALSEEAKKNLKEKVTDDFNSIELLGANQFLNKYPVFNAESLAILYDNLKNIKLAGGTHCVKANIKGKNVVIFNGFHPEQLERYTKSGTVIVCLVFQTKTSWRILRSEMTGLTNPQNSPTKSIRKTLFEKKEMLGLDEVSPGKNGVHVSAGPIEGMIEIVRFFGSRNNGKALNYEGTTFGKLLKKNDFSSQQISQLISNPDVIVNGKPIPLFDYTEETDSLTASEKITDHFKPHDVLK